MKKRPPEQIRNITGTNKNVKKTTKKASELVDAMKSSGLLVLELPNTLRSETKKEFQTIFDSLNNIGMLSAQDLPVLRIAANLYDRLLNLNLELDNIDETEETLQLRLVLIGKIESVSKSVYTLLAKYFVTPEDRFKAALSVARGEKKQTPVTRMIDE